MEPGPLTGQPWTIRPGGPGDLDGIEAIETAAFDQDRLERRSLRRFLTVATTETVVAAAGAGLVGYAMIGFRRTSTIGRIFTLAVVRRLAGRGIGGALLAGCEEAAWRRGCARVQLEVREDNTAALALYARAGYGCFGRFADYYEDGAPALRYAKERPGADAGRSARTGSH